MRDGDFLVVCFLGWERSWGEGMASLSHCPREPMV